MAGIIGLHRNAGFKLQAMHIVKMRSVGMDNAPASSRRLFQSPPVSRSILLLLFYPVGKIEVIECMFYIDGAWFAVKIEPQPVVHFKSKDIRRCTDLEHQVIYAGAVHGTIGDQGTDRVWKRYAPEHILLQE